MATGDMTTAGTGPNALRWDLLEGHHPTGERLIVRMAFPDRCSGLLIALDAAGRRHLLVEIPAGEDSEIAERTSRGIAVQTVEFNTGEGQAGRFVEIACLEPEGHAALDTIALELADALNAGASIGRVRLVQNVLSKWRRFWSGVSQGLLSKEQQFGLFGELWFLARWLAPSLGIGIAVEMWRGPGGARNDFEKSGMAIEVKTTGRVDGGHVIHGLDQLLDPPGGRLMLFSLLVRDEASGTESLSTLVGQVRGLIGADYNLHSRFDAMLYAAGYDDRLAAEYAKLVLRIRGEGLYRVEEGFPRLVPSSIVTGLPIGVSNIQYELRLDSAGTWLLASNPSAAAAQFVTVLN